MSDDGSHAIVVIALLGNPFSPRRSHGARALDFCAMHVALYGPRARAWALHERPVRVAERTSDGAVIGGSTIQWDGGALVVELDERSTPFRRAIRGRVVLRPDALTSIEVPIDADGRHRWWPVAPTGRIQVDLRQPGLRFRGNGYHDANAGDAPLESAFARWSWSRARTSTGAVLAYDVVGVGGARTELALTVRASGDVDALGGSWSAPLPRTSWGLDRTARADHGARARVVRSLEDGPFYARGLVATRLGGCDVVAMHETLDASRLARRWVRFLAGFRTRRTA